MRKKILSAFSIIYCFLLSLGLSGCLSNHVAEGFGNAVWYCDDPYFYWHEDISYKKALYHEDINYVMSRNAPDEEILTLYGEMQIGEEITFIEFIRGDLDSRHFSFDIVVFRTSVIYLDGVYTYERVKDETHDYEVYLTVQHAYDTDIVNDTDGTITGEEVELPFDSFTIYVTLDS